MKLYKHQQAFLDKNPDKHLLVHSTGTGKTITALQWARKKRYDIRGAPPFLSATPYIIDFSKSASQLIICPKHLKSKWLKEFKYCAIHNLTPVWSTKQFIDQGKIVIMSKEEFRRDWDKIPRHDVVIVDEVHYFAGTKSQMSKNLLKYINKHKVDYILGLTATPYMSTPMNIYNIGKIVGMTGGTWSYPYFMRTFFNKIMMGGRLVPVVKKNISHLLADKVKEISDVVDMKDCVDLPDDVMTIEYIKSTSAQKKFEKTLSEPNHLTRWTKIHQACGGVVKGDAYNPDQEIESAKLPLALDFISSHKKSIVVCRYVGEISIFGREIMSSSKRELLNKQIFVITGDVDDKQAVLDQANASDDCVLLVTAQCSEGWEAKTFDAMLFYSYDFSLKNYIQMKGRIQRIDAIHKCHYHSIVVEKSIDEDVYDNVVVKKMDFQTNIYKK